MNSVNSISSFFIAHTSYQRNHNKIDKFTAQLGFSACVAISLIEAVAAASFFSLSIFTYPLSSKPLGFTSMWLKSSTFAVCWSVVDFCINPFCEVLIVSEAEAQNRMSVGKIIRKRENEFFDMNEGSDIWDKYIFDDESKLEYL